MTEHDEHWRWAVGPAPIPAPAAAAASATATATASAAGAGAGNAAGTGAGKTAAGTAAAPPVLRAGDRWRAALADRLPPTLRGRWALDRATGTVLAVSVLLGAVLLGGWAVLRSRPHELSVARGRPAAATGATGEAGVGAGTSTGVYGSGPGSGFGAGAGSGTGAGVASSASGSGSGGPGVVVDVEGRVARPGVRTLPAGSRVIDALTAAGGALPGTDLSALNQARVLVDGEQVLVGVTPPPAPPSAAPGRGGKGKGRAGAGGAEPVHLNSAEVEDLEQLPGIGPALAQRIVDYRTAHGPFHSVEDLQEVSGFGGQRYQTLAPLLTL